MATLKVVRGPDQGKVFHLGPSLNRIGRGSRCQIQLNDTETSRKHAEIVLEEDAYVFRDLKSSNGSIINGQLTEFRRLLDGDRILIGRNTFVFESQEARLKSSDQEYLQSSVSILGEDLDDGSRIVSVAEADNSIEDTELFDPDAAKPDPASKSLWEIMYRTSLAVSRTLDIDHLLEQIVDLIFQWVQCDHACVMLKDPKTHALRPVFRKNRRPRSNYQIIISKTILDYVLNKEEGVLTSNARSDVRWKSSASIEASGVREAICVPLRGRYGVVGALYIDTVLNQSQRLQLQSERIFNEDHLKMMIAIGHQTALAIEDTTFYRSTLQTERLAAVGQTIASLSHHVKNIMQGLRGGGYMVNQGLSRNDESAVRSGWQICEKSHARIEALMLDMLTMSKERAPQRQATDLRKIIQEVVELAEVSASQGKVTLEWTPPAHFPEMSIDPEGLHRAILNLVMNAIDATLNRENARVSIELIEEDEEALVRVKDNGVGIPDSRIDSIFSLFESTKGNQGTGLGLPVSQKIVEEHGGEILVTSKVDQGATFTIHLPWMRNKSAGEEEV